MRVLKQCTEIIGTIERGDAAQDLTNEIERTLKALQDAAGEKRAVKGSVTLTLNFTLEGQNMEIEAAISSKLPKTKRPRTFMFLNGAGQLTNEHPSQTSIFDKPRVVGESTSA